MSLPSPAFSDSMMSLVTPKLRHSNSSLTPEEQFRMLVEFNDAKAALYIPVIAYMLILTIVGTFGNILVCCVYCTKATKTASTFFILALATLDLLTCLIGMPTEITDLRYPYMFKATAACKMLRFTESVTTIGSSVVLIAVAIDRYRRICKLGRMISVACAKRISIVAMMLGVLLSWPAVFIFGRSTTFLHPEIPPGVDCSTDDSMRKTHYPSMYYGFLGLLFICCTVFFSITYCSVGLQIWRQKRAKIGQNCNNRDTKGRTFSNSSTKEDQSTVSAETPPEVASDHVSTDMSSEQMAISKAKRKQMKERRMSATSFSSANLKAAKKRTIKVTRNTVVLFAVTVAYVVSFLPFLIIMVARSVKKDLEDNLTPAEEVAFKFATKSYFINNAINPLIYSFLNLNFRKDARNLLLRIMNACVCWRKDGS